MLSTKGTASSPAQKQWPFRCCRPDYSGMVTPTPAPCRLFPPVQNKRKVPARRKRAFPWISFMTCRPVCPLQKPSPNHCWTGTPSSTQIAPTSSASGSFCYGSPKSLTSHPSCIRTKTDPTWRSVSCCIIFPQMQRGTWSWSFTSSPRQHLSSMPAKKWRGKITAEELSSTLASSVPSPQAACFSFSE